MTESVSVNDDFLAILHRNVISHTAIAEIKQSTFQPEYGAGLSSVYGNAAAAAGKNDLRRTTRGITVSAACFAEI